MLAQLKNKIIVVKCGGAAMVESAQMQEMLEALVVLHQAGVRLVLVHGGGPEITKYCQKLNMPVQFIKGQRVSDAATLELAQMVLFGKTNRSMVTHLNQCGIQAVGLTGQDAACVKAKKWQDQDGTDLGFVGSVEVVDPRLINTLMQAGFLPVVAPIATSSDGQTYNVNGDLMAGAIAGALKAEKLIMLTDVNGYYNDIKDPNSRVPELTQAKIETLLTLGKVEGGMVPKLQACVAALAAGVKAAHLLQGNKLKQFFANEDQQAIGTVIQ